MQSDKFPTDLTPDYFATQWLSLLPAQAQAYKAAMDMYLHGCAAVTESILAMRALEPSKPLKRLPGKSKVPHDRAKFTNRTPEQRQIAVLRAVRAAQGWASLGLLMGEIRISFDAIKRVLKHLEDTNQVKQVEKNRNPRHNGMPHWGTVKTYWEVV